MTRLLDWLEYRRCLHRARREARDFWANVPRWEWSEG
jgi:hypothetical protein